MTVGCRIRSVAEDDLPMLRAWRNHPAIRSFMLTRHEISEEEHSKWFAQARQDATRRLLVVEEGSAPLGYVQFSGVAAGGISDWGFYARANAPKGTGKKLGITALNYAFDDLGLHKVCGQAIAGNHASIALHRKLGFVEEGLLRDHHRIDGDYHSLVCFGLLQEEWRAVSSGLGEEI